ncbi:MAG TPA: S41 family peptidase, partial [Vicinamibacteria bacterium]|nr:S41 family peptidase [Vicinamibacteria bacterium]
MAAVLVTTAACGSSNTTPSSSSSPPTYTAGTYPPSSSLINQCATPRTGNDPVTGTAYPDQPGSTMAENMFLRSWTNELYLWYHEVPDTNPAGYATADYFNLLKTSATTPSGHPKDKFHFTYVTTDWESLSQSGVSAGYGAQFAVVAGSPPRQVVVAFTDPNTPATAANLARGAEILTVDGVDVVNGSDTTTLNNGLFPTAAGQTHSFSVQDLGSSAPRTISMTSANVTETPVQNVTTIQTRAGNVGYMLFNDHIATAEQLLVNGFTQLSSSGVSDLVLDIRYNGGGYLDIASEVAYMIAGPGPTTGKTFDRTVFNDKYPNTDPVQNQPLTPTPFHN